MDIQEALSPCLLVVAVKAEAGEAFLPHGDHAHGLNGRCATESENQWQTKGARGLNQRILKCNSFCLLVYVHICCF
jgi:hypothetical protein